MGRADLWYPVGLAVVFVGGAAWRAWHLGDGVRYDEATTFLYYALGSWRDVLADLSHPNNHILNSVIVKVLYTAAGDAPVTWRLHSFATGLAVMALTAHLARRLFGPLAALTALAFIAASPPIMQFSALARGYQVSLAAGLTAFLLVEHRLAGARGFWLGAGIAACAAVGCLAIHSGFLFVVPVGLYELTLTLKREPRRAGAWLLTWGAGALLTAAVYAPGLSALLATRGGGETTQERLLPGWTHRSTAYRAGLVDPHTWGWGGLYTWAVLGAAGTAVAAARRPAFAVLLAFTAAVSVGTFIFQLLPTLRMFVGWLPWLAIAAGALVAAVGTRWAKGREYWLAAAVVAWAAVSAAMTESRGLIASASRSGPAPGAARLAAALTRLNPPAGPVVMPPRYLHPILFYLHRSGRPNAFTFEQPEAMFTRRSYVVVPTGYTARDVVASWVEDRPAAVYYERLRLREKGFEIWDVGVALLNGPRADAPAGRRRAAESEPN